VPVKLKPENVNQMHKKASKFIRSAIDRSPHEVIVLTHHKPFISEEDRKLYKELTGYHSDQTSMLTGKQKEKIKYWFYGHTHKHFDGKYDGIHFISNPRGYPKQQTKFENNLVINL
jgi:hypothetical protein